MKVFRRLLIYFGGVYFAVLLIAVSAFFVVAGTFLESATDSHRYASAWTYGNPFFSLLLWMFFLNIFLATVRRWPFQIRHIPFLITHLGLLMILAGCLVKNYYGLQGNMVITEGGGSDTVILPETYALLVESRKNSSNGRRSSEEFPLTRSTIVAHSPHFPELRISLSDSFPHSKEEVQTWFRNDHLTLFGVPPIRMGSKGKLGDWELLPLNAEDAWEVAKRVWVSDSVVTLKDADGKQLHHYLLPEDLDQPLTFEGGVLHFSLAFQQSNPHLNCKYELVKPQRRGNFRVPLVGEASLIPVNLSTKGLGKPPICLEISRKPTLLFIRTPSGEIEAFSLASNGEVGHDTIRQGLPDSFIAYNEGFGGYAVSWKIPLVPHPASPKNKQTAMLSNLCEQLTDAFKSGQHLAPPLRLLASACERCGIDPARGCVTFLDFWDKHGGWLATHTEIPQNLRGPLALLCWDEVPKHERLAAFWGSKILAGIDEGLRRGKELPELLEESNWPLSNRVESYLDENTAPEKSILQKISRDLFELGEQLPSPPTTSYTVERNLQILSQLFRLYSIHLEEIPKSYPPKEKGELIEAPLVFLHLPEEPKQKLEENVPAVHLIVTSHGKKETVSLGYNSHGGGLKTPVGRGDFLVRYQAQHKCIPYRLRLRQARTIRYPGTDQPYSYESDLIILDKTAGTSIEKTISMNNVHETWDGYRFYLSGIAPPTEENVKTVTIAVNHDPGKYLLTYPGAAILSIGIFLLFWIKPYAKQKKK